MTRAASRWKGLGDTLFEGRHALTRLVPLVDWLLDRLPPGSGVAAWAVGSPRESEFADEDRLVARAVSGRRAQFQAGRSAARMALAMLGHEPGPILARAEGDPIWPEGVVGSITHTERWALAVAARLRAPAGLGVDLETDSPLDEDLVEMICRPEERRPHPRLQARGIDAPKLRFVAKEAVYKAVFPLTREFIDFNGVSIVFETGGDAFEATFVGSPDGNIAGRRFLNGWFHHGAGLLCAVCLTA